MIKTAGIISSQMPESAHSAAETTAVTASMRTIALFLTAAAEFLIMASTKRLYEAALFFKC
jgi:hypothetical protein